MAAEDELIELILRDHRSFKARFPLVMTETGEARTNAFHDLMRDLIVHEVAEEEIVWPEVREHVQNGEKLAQERTHEEAEAEKVLKELENMDTASTEFATKFSSLKEDVTNHADAEERDVLPQLRAACTPERLQELGTWWIRAKKTAPTHPHPKAPNEGKSQVVGGAILSSVDRVRDAIRGIKQ